MISLWSINRWLRWTGFRLVVDMDENRYPATLIGLRWFGLYGSAGWRRIGPRG